MTIIDNVWNINERDANGKLLNVEFARVNPLSIIETFDIRQETNRSVADAKLSLTYSFYFIIFSNIYFALFFYIYY